MTGVQTCALPISDELKKLLPKKGKNGKNEPAVEETLPTDATPTNTLPTDAPPTEEKKKE